MLLLRGGELLARAIQSGAYERGFVMCGSGAGVCMTAGKFRGVYAVACESEYTAAELRRITKRERDGHGRKSCDPRGGRAYGTGICGQRLVRRHDAGQSRYGT